MSSVPAGQDGAESAEESAADLPRSRPGFLERRWVPPVFFAATVLSVFLVGLQHGADYYFTLGEKDPGFAAVALQGLIYTAALVAILGCHEMGHWLVAAAHGVRTSLPVFIPVPLGLGTFGAVIAMRELPPDRTTLLRIGAAGPLAGGVVALALMAIAIPTCPVIQLPEIADAGETLYYMELGDSVGTWLMQLVMRQEVPAGHDVLATPLFFAAWAGFLLTSINLFPVGQLDGGHVAYALFGERVNRWGPRIALAVIVLSLAGLAFGNGFSPGYVVWGLLLRYLLAWHPPVPRPEPALGRGSAAIVAASVLLFLLTFMPAPLRIVW